MSTADSMFGRTIFHDLLATTGTVYGLTGFKMFKLVFKIDLLDV